MLSICERMPKIELHAHLNGSISQETMEKLLSNRRENDNALLNQHKMIIAKGERKTIEDCFAAFRLIHQVTDTLDAIYLVVCDVIREFSDDNVKYLELRSTPRENQSTGMTREGYVQTVLKGIERCKVTVPGVVVKFILAIDRRNSLEVAEETVALAARYLAAGDVVGIDLSGDPSQGNAADFIPVLVKARAHGLKLALHLSEIPANEETYNILRHVPPDRIGHGTFLRPEDGGESRLVDMVSQSKIPLEICLTSNVKCQTVSTFDNHHFDYWYNAGHLCAISTDDKGVFATTLSNEYRIAAETFQLSPSQIFDLSLSTIDLIFAGQATKDRLKNAWTDFLSEENLRA